MYTGISSILKSTIEVSLAMTSGTGGVSIGPTFTYYPTVDSRSDPAFRTLRLLVSYFKVDGVRKGETFVAECATKVLLLLHQKRVFPTAVDKRGQSLLHHATRAVRAEPSGLICRWLTDC